MTIDEATSRILVLASTNRGMVAAHDVEADRALAREPDAASTAARRLALRVGVVAVYASDRAGWFPFGHLLFRALGSTRHIDKLDHRKE